MSSSSLPLGFNHVALSCTSIDSVIEFYTTIFGFTVTKPMRHLTRETSPSANLFKIYGPSLEEVKVAYLMSENKIGFELFEFIRPAHKVTGGVGGAGKGEGEFEYARQGFFHVCVTCEDVDGKVGEVVKAGGKHVGETITVKEGVRAAYVKDPWGNVVEIVNVPWDRLTASV